LIRRFSVGDIVVDQEAVTSTFPEGPGEIDVLAIYGSRTAGSPGRGS